MMTVRPDLARNNSPDGTRNVLQIVRLHVCVSTDRHRTFSETSPVETGPLYYTKNLGKGCRWTTTTSTATPRNVSFRSPKRPSRLHPQKTTEYTPRPLPQPNLTLGVGVGLGLTIYYPFAKELDDFRQGDRELTYSTTLNLLILTST